MWGQTHKMAINVTVKKSPRVITTAGNTKPKVLLNQSGLLARGISDLVDVDASGRSDGDLLIYDASQEKFVVSSILDKQHINGGHF